MSRHHIAISLYVNAPYRADADAVSSEVETFDRHAVVRILGQAGCIAPEAEADELIAAAAGDAEILSSFVARRTTGEPVAWITGMTTFCGVGLSILPGVYVPRPQTELLARRAAELLPPGGIAVDLCTGSGAVAAVLTASDRAARVVATDIDPIAVRCARLNGIEVFEGHLDEPLPHELEGCVDVVTAVAPYVPTDAIGLLPRDVQTFEPGRALDGGHDGTELLDQIAARSRRWLRPGGWLLMELGGRDQAENITRSLRAFGIDETEVLVDADGDVRGICGRRLAQTSESID
jgi:release factor glutamine methyltransferase